MSRGDVALKIFCLYNVLLGTVILFPMWLFLSSNPYYGRVTLTDKVLIGVFLFVIILKVAGGAVIWTTRSRVWFWALVGENTLMVAGIILLFLSAGSVSVDGLALVIALSIFVGLGFKGRASIGENRAKENGSEESTAGEPSR